MRNEEYVTKRKELVSGQARERSKVYPALVGIFFVLIIVNAVMLVLNNM